MDQYEFIEKMESKHWWFVARTNIFKAIIESYDDEIDGFLDVGCGTGNFISKIEPIADDIYGIDPHVYKVCKADDIIKGTAEQLPFDNNTFDFVSCFDVLGHVENPEEVLNGILRVMKPGAFAIITVPAHPLLYGPSDKEHGRLRRFSKRNLNAIINKRYEVVKASYFNMFLFPIYAVIRFFEKVLNYRFIKDQLPNPKLNKFLFKVFSKEKNMLLQKNLPFGMSYMLVLRKRR